MHTLEWNPLLDTGVAEMDAAHRKLMQAMQATIVAAPAALPARISELLQALAADFAEEEALMDQLHFPAAHAHRAAHGRVMAALRHALPVAQHDADSARALLEKLPRWFLGHLSAMDLPLAVAVERASRPYSQPPAAGLRQQLARLLQEQSI